MYIIKNLSGKELEMDWTIDLLPEDAYAEWKEFEKTPEYTKQIKEEKRRIIDMLNDFVTDKGLGKLGFGYSNDPMTGSQIRFPKYKYILGKDSIILVNARTVGRFRSLERTAVEQTDGKGNITDEVQYEGFLEIEEVPEDYKLDVKTIGEDESVDIVTGKTYPQLRKLAYSRGLKPKPGLKMPELIILIKEDVKKKGE